MELATESAGTLARSSTVRTRIALTLTGVALGLAVLTMVMVRGQRQQVDALMRDRAAENQRVLERILELHARGPALHVDDYSRWDEFVSFVRSRDAEWANVNLDQSIATFGIDGAWVLDARQRLVYTSTPEDAEPLPADALPLPRLADRLAHERVLHFFTRTTRGYLEVWTSPIRPSDDFARQTFAGTYVIGRLWTPARIAEISSASGGSVRVLAGGGLEKGSVGDPETGVINVTIGLPGLDGRPVADLVERSDFPVGRRVNEALRMAALFAFAMGLLGVLGVWWVMARWVMDPLRAIGEAMRVGEAERLGRLGGREDEIGALARLVEQFFAQRATLVAARQAAESLTEAKSRFLANVSHELRTPMHAILSFSRFGLRDAETAPREDLRGHFHHVHESGKGLLEMLNALLDLSRLEAHRMTFDYGALQVNDVVDSVADEFRSLYHERDIALELALEPALAPMVADRVRITQVVRNLVSNAAKFTPGGGVVRVRTESAGDRQRIVVEDTGRGIPPGEEHAIFEAFIQASHTASASGGTGLGLAICREIVEAHEGEVWAENRADAGARFVVELPVSGPAGARPPAGAALRGTQTPASPSPGNDNHRWKSAA